MNGWLVEWVNGWSCDCDDDVVAAEETVEAEEGTFVFPDGGKYIGVYRTTGAGIIVRHDRGVMKFANGQVYDGQWEDDTMCGQGVLSFPNGATYQVGPPSTPSQLGT